jgi:predicted flap endonuclease-1-like 5' DNA nuclease
MRVRRVAQAVSVGLLLMIIASAVPASAQGAQPPPTSLRVELQDLFITSGANLQNGTAPADTPCGPGAGQGIPPSATWSYALPFNGSYHIRDTISATIVFGQPASAAPGVPPPPAAAPQGATVTAKLEGSENPITAPPATIAGPTVAGTLTFTFTPNETAPLVGAAGTPLKLTVTVATPQAQGNNFQAHCGENSRIGAPLVYRGGPTAGDIDGDSIPDLEDQDRDGDGALNTAEPGTCAFYTPPRAYADNPETRVGADTDGDGVNDDVECAATPASNPSNPSSVPARPPSLLAILLPWILLLVVLGLIAAIVFVFLKYGKTAAVVIVSQPELFIPPGTKGKYEVSVQNLSKKGEARTYQLAVAGMPEGWDAKLNNDHVTLEPEGGATNKQSVWLEVEAPAHNEAESAVVTVKATPLNKAGRKDTFKLGGKAETITSINVPPGSKVPVKRGGKIETAEAKEEAAPAAGDVGTGDSDQRPVVDIEGVGATYSAKLEKMGIKTVGELRRADSAAVAKKVGTDETTVKQWQAMGDLMNLEGVGPQFAEQLVRSGIMSIAQLADEKPKPLVEKVETTNKARATPIQGAGIQEKQAKNFIKAAEKFLKKNPGAVPAAAAAAAAPAAAAAAAPTPAAPAGAPPAKPQLQVGGLRHEPPAFRQGDAVKSIVNVTNNGKDKSTIKLSLYVNDGLADVQTVTVKAGKAQDVQFKWTAQEKNKLNIRGEVVPS